MPGAARCHEEDYVCPGSVRDLGTRKNQVGNPPAGKQIPHLLATAGAPCQDSLTFQHLPQRYNRFLDLVRDQRQDAPFQSRP